MPGGSQFGTDAYWCCMWVCLLLRVSIVPWLKVITLGHGCRMWQISAAHGPSMTGRYRCLRAHPCLDQLVRIDSWAGMKYRPRLVPPNQTVVSFLVISALHYHVTSSWHGEHASLRRLCSAIVTWATLISRTDMGISVKLVVTPFHYQPCQYNAKALFLDNTSQFYIII